MRALSAKYIFDGESLLENKAILVENNIIFDIVDKATLSPNELTDYGLGVISSGFIDLQLNGCGGVLFNDDISLDTLETMYKTCLKFGTTGFFPTLITSDVSDIIKALTLIKQWFSLYQNRRGVLGLHIEGPFISKDKKGIHAEDYIILPQQELLEQIVAYKSFFPILMTVAIEKFETDQLQYLVDNGIHLSIGHSNASYIQAQNSFKIGINNATHLFNAMSGMTGRNPGVIGAVMNNDCYAGIIADLFHVDAANINFLNKIKRGRIYLVTDAMPPTGTNLTEFMLGNKRLIVKDGKCVNESGVLGGALLTMNQAIKNCVKSCDIELVDALKMATVIPANAMDLNQGRLIKGKDSKLIYLDINDYSCSLI